MAGEPPIMATASGTWIKAQTFERNFETGTHYSFAMFPKFTIGTKMDHYMFEQLIIG